MGVFDKKTSLSFVFELFSLRIEPDDVEGGDINRDKGGRGVTKIVTNGDKGGGEGEGGQNQ